MTISVVSGIVTRVSCPSGPVFVNVLIIAACSPGVVYWLLRSWLVWELFVGLQAHELVTRCHGNRIVLNLDRAYLVTTTVSVFTSVATHYSLLRDLGYTACCAHASGTS